MRRALIAVTVAIASVASLVVSPGVAGAASKPLRGGNITTVSIAFMPANWDPGTTTIDAYYSMVYDTLVYVDTQSGEIKPRLAQSLTSTDGTVWTLKLRPNVKFTDGTTLDANAVKVNWARIGAPDSAAQLKRFALPIQAMDVLDPLTLKITLTGPLGSFPENVAALSSIASPTALQKYGSEYGTSIDKIVGAGPFKVSEWIRSNKVVMTRNPDYWNKPKPYLDSLTFLLIQDSTQAFNAFQTGQVQVLQDATGTNTATAKSSGDKVLALPPSDFAIRYLFNLKKEPFNDPKARQALNYALDMNKVNQIQNNGKGIVFDGPYTKASQWYMPSVKLPKYNHQKAQQLFNEVAQKLGHPVTFNFIYPATGSTTGDMMTALLADYQNVKVTVTAVQPSAYIQTVLTGNWELVLFGIEGTPNYVTTYFSTGSPSNYGGYSNPTVDEGAKIGREEATVPARKKGYTQAFTQLMVDLPAIWIAVVSATNSMLYDKTVVGLNLDALEGQTSGLHVRFDQLSVKKS